MNEILQDDDSEPHPVTAREYCVNYQTDLTYEDDGLATELAYLQEVQDIQILSALASQLLERDAASGDQTNRVLRVDNASLKRQISDGSWRYTFEDYNNEGQARCRVWRLGGDSVNWCENEQRYEPAREIMERIAATFAHTAPIEKKLSIKNRLKRVVRNIGKSSLSAASQ